MVLKNCRIEPFWIDAPCPPNTPDCDDCPHYLTDEEFEEKKKRYGVVD